MPQYQGVWTLQQQAQASTSQQWVTDPLFENTTFLLQADNVANGSQNNIFIDSGPYSLPITRNGNTTQGTFTPFSQAPGYWSNYFDGLSRFSTPAGLSTALGNGLAGNTFTFEAWIFPSVFGSSYSYVTAFLGSYDAVAANGRWFFGFVGSAGNMASLDFSYTTGTGTQVDLVAPSPTIQLGQWSHVAVTIDATTSTNATVRLFHNGRLLLTSTGNNMSTQGTFYSPPTIGGTGYLNQLTGYISNLRMIRGSLLYSGGYSVPTAPLSNITNTRLLICQSNRFVDNGTANSGSGFALTIASGTPSVQAFSPFAPQYQYTPSVIGGSAYFDGTGDYLSLPANSLWAFGTADLSVEFWCYLTATGTTAQTFIGNRNSTSDARWFINYLTGSAKIEFSGGTTQMISTNSTLTLNQWYHVVVTRQSGRWRVFLNGVMDNTTTTSGNFTDAAVPLYVGSQLGSTYYVYGYISNMRVVTGSVPTGYQTSSTVNGTAVFTPPTAPVTTTSQGATASNVSLLINATNAGIYDSTSKIILETVSTAQVSTSVVKYGSGSLFFNGTSDYLFVNSGFFQNYAFGIGDFTIEAWINPTTFTADRVIVSSYNAWATSVNFYFGIRAGTPNIIIFRAGDNVPISINGDTPIVLGTWQHVAVCRANGVTRMFVNGVQQTATHTGSVNVSNTVRPLVVGRGDAAATEFFPGYMDDLRITKGLARYLQNFTPPLVALPRQ